MDCIVVEVIRRIDEPWGIQITGESPCYIDSVKPDSPADEAGICVGDCIFSVNGISAHDATHEQVVQLIADSGRLARFKLLPNTNASTSFTTPIKEEGESFWTEDNNNKTPTKSENDENFDHTDYEKFCQMLKSDSTETKSESRKSHKKEKRKKKVKKATQKDEQSSFIVTREDQRVFDNTFETDCTFQGKKAAMAGAYTGDHNVIVNEHDDICGVRARVRAGIQHFSYEDEQEKINPADRGKIIVYTTSLGIHRSVAQSCEQSRKILKGYRVRFEDKDIFTNSEYKDELYERLGLNEGDKFPEMPRVYIDGVYIGGASELQAMGDCGDLRIRLQEFPKYNLRSQCPTCSATSQVTCHSCKGKAFRKKNRFAMLKCGTCKQKGKLECPDCLA